MYVSIGITFMKKLIWYGKISGNENSSQVSLFATAVMLFNA
jgi:hypothetical protein